MGGTRRQEHYVHYKIIERDITSILSRTSPPSKMCFWREVYYIFCRHYSRDPVECIDAKQTNERCEDWDTDDKEMESRTANGTPYIKAEPTICMDCKYKRVLREQAVSKRSEWGPEGKAP